MLVVLLFPDVTGGVVIEVSSSDISVRILEIFHHDVDIDEVVDIGDCESRIIRQAMTEIKRQARAVVQAQK